MACRSCSLTDFLGKAMTRCIDLHSGLADKGSTAKRICIRAARGRYIPIQTSSPRCITMLEETGSGHSPAAQPVMPVTHRLLLIEDDASLASMVAAYLSTEDFQVSIEPRGDVAVQRILSEPFDAIIFDVNLPGLDGFTICRSVRASFAGPIIILTARGEEVDEVVGLEVGADDYLSKPVRPRVLLARLRANLRRTTWAPGESGPAVLALGELRIDPRRRTVHLGAKAIDTSSAEFDVLWLLAQQAGRVVSRKDIFESLHGFPYDGVDRSVDLRISRLRRKLGDDTAQPQLIKSVRGAGYLLSLEP